MAEKLREAELKEMVEQKISQLLESEKEKLETYKNMSDIDMTQRHRQLGKVDALQRLEIEVKSICTTGHRLHTKENRSIGLKDLLGNNNVYLNTVFFHAMTIKDNRRMHDFSAASSPEAEDGKVEVMSQMMKYIKTIKI